MWFLCAQEFKENVQKHKKEIRQQKEKSNLTVEERKSHMRNDKHFIDKRENIGT